MRSLPLLFGLLAITVGAAQLPPPQTIPELRHRIEMVLATTRTPGLGIALVGRDGPIWTEGVGLADAERVRPATADTLFPIGSISKAFVALSVLKLQQEGRIALEDTLRSRVPELEFVNPWETTDPVRIVHLLEHTSGGWASDNTAEEQVWNAMPGRTRREVLTVYPRSCTSRWRPGTRYLYSNLGPAIAAYLVEKITGEGFEDYVTRTWFKPLGMAGAAYFETPEVLASMAKGYRQGGEAIVYPVFDILNRPAGGIVASPRDMANLVEFFLNRGSFRGNRLLPGSAIDRMELPTTTFAAAEGLKTGYGLNNYTSVRGKWVFHGHNGWVGGALADLEYVPEAGMGYAMMINCDRANAYDAQRQVGQLVRDYLLRDRATPPLPPPAPADAALKREYAGWYEPITPRFERMTYLERILGLTQLTTGEGQLYLRDLKSNTAYARTKGRLYRKTGDFAPTLALIADHSDGTLFQFAGGATFRRLPRLRADLELGGALATALLMVSVAIFAPGWVPKTFTGGLKGGPDVRVRLAALLTTLSAAAVFVLIWDVSGDHYARAGGALWGGDPAILVLRIAHWIFASLAVRGLLLVLHHRRSLIRRSVWWHSFAVSLALMSWATYLSYWGLRAEFSL